MPQLSAGDNAKKKKSAISALFLDVLLTGQKYSFVLIYFIPHYQTLSDDNPFYSPWKCAPPLILLHRFWAPSIPEAFPKTEYLNCTHTPLTNYLYLPALIFFHVGKSPGSNSALMHKKHLVDFSCPWTGGYCLDVSPLLSCRHIHR